MRYEGRRRMMNIEYTKSVLSRQSCCSGHSIAAMSRDDLLIRLEASIKPISPFEET